MSSVIVATWRAAPPRAGVATLVSACRMPAGHNTRTTSARARAPRPKTRSAGAAGGVEAMVSIRWRRLPARTSTFAPTALRLLTRAARRTVNDACRLPPSFRHARTRPDDERTIDVDIAVAVDVANAQ